MWVSWVLLRPWILFRSPAVFSRRIISFINSLDNEINWGFVCIAPVYQSIPQERLNNTRLSFLHPGSNINLRVFNRRFVLRNVFGLCVKCQAYQTLLCKCHGHTNTHKLLEIGFVLLKYELLSEMCVIICSSVF